MARLRVHQASRKDSRISFSHPPFTPPKILIFKIGLRDPIDVPQPVGLVPSIRHALGESTRTGTFVDTRFFVYSKRAASSGRVFHPLPVYGNSSLLSEKSDYMKTRESPPTHAFSRQP
jgi:hypothetical protein